MKSYAVFFKKPLQPLVYKQEVVFFMKENFISVKENPIPVETAHVHPIRAGYNRLIYIYNIM